MLNDNTDPLQPEPGSGAKRMTLRGSKHASAMMDWMESTVRTTNLVLAITAKHLKKKVVLVRKGLQIHNRTDSDIKGL